MGRIIEATTSLGLPYVEDLNSPLHPSHGCAKMHYTIDKSGQRSSTLTAFLPSSLTNSRKHNLHICTRTVVRRIEVTNHDGALTADGVWIQGTAGAAPIHRFVRARREVILSAGPMGSPQMLQLRLVHSSLCVNHDNETLFIAESDQLHTCRSTESRS